MFSSKFFRVSPSIVFFLVTYEIIKTIGNKTKTPIKRICIKDSLEIPNIDFKIEDFNGSLKIDVFDVQAIHTPGHTNGSCCLLVDDVILTGDTLFKGEVGRYDLPGGNKEKLNESLKKLTDLPGNLSVFPGHGEPTTLQNEVVRNLKLKKILHKL